MTYATASEDLFLRFPELREEADRAFALEDDGSYRNYIVYGSVLLPFLEQALEQGALKTILLVCAYLEDAAVAARTDGMLGTLIAVEIGEWLAWTKYEHRISPWLGADTKRICAYVPGLATQRLQIRAEKRERSLKNRLRAFWNRARS